MEKKRILCLDLDGTVRRSKSGKIFIEGPDDIELIPGVYERIWKYNDEEWLIIYFTNQGGVAHGFKTEEQARDEIDATLELLEREDSNQGRWSSCWEYFMCPHEANGKIEEYSFRSLARKPYYGMLVCAEQSLLDEGFIPDWDNSLFVGDQPEDEGCAKAASIPFMHIDDFLKQPV
jgi:D-glycero-D-manno-heptose 1,7-bisphosphate phosphatase